MVEIDRFCFFLKVGEVVNERTKTPFIYVSNFNTSSLRKLVGRSGSRVRSNPHISFRFGILQKIVSVFVQKTHAFDFNLCV